MWLPGGHAKRGLVAVMGIQDHGRCAGERGSMARSALNPLRSWEIMGENYPLLGR